MAFEKYCSKLFNKQILIKDFNQDNKLLEKTLKLIIADFEEFTMHYSRTSYKQEQIDIWKNILINIRILFQYRILIISDTIQKSIEKLLQINNIDIFGGLFTNYDLSEIVLLCYRLFCLILIKIIK